MQLDIKLTKYEKEIIDEMEIGRNYSVRSFKRWQDEFVGDGTHHFHTAMNSLIDKGIINYRVGVIRIVEPKIIRNKVKEIIENSDCMENKLDAIMNLVEG